MYFGRQQLQNVAHLAIFRPMRQPHETRDRALYTTSLCRYPSTMIHVSSQATDNNVFRPDQPKRYAIGYTDTQVTAARHEIQQK